jgi:drug/metabolite transporter (DMT)-like permease
MPPGTRRAGFSRVDLGLGATIVIWGVNYAAIKAALAEIQPFAFNALRFVFATLTLVALVRLRGPVPHITRKDLVKLVLLGILGNTIYQIIFIEGIAHTTASNASLIMSSCPMLVALMGAALGRDRLPISAWIGVTLAGGGLVLLLSSGSRSRLETGNWSGDLLILAAAATWATYTVLATGVMARTPPIPATLVTFLSGTPPLVAFAVPSLRSQNWAAVGMRGWFGVGFSGILAIGVAYMLWNVGLSALGGARTAIYQNFTPVVAAAFAWLTLGERWTVPQFAGAAAVIIGIALTRRGSAFPVRADRVSAEPPQPPPVVS